MTDKTFHVYCQFDALFSLIKKQLQSRLEKYALLPGHVMLLKTLKEQPGLAQNELAKAVFRETSTLTTTLKTLEKRALIKKEIAKEDKRTYQLYLTEYGRASFYQCQQDFSTFRQELFQTLCEEDQKAIKTIFDKLLNTLKEMDNKEAKPCCS